jgi:hypothetical protein
VTEPVTLITCSGLSNTGKLTTQAGVALLRASPGLVEACVPANRPQVLLEEAARYAERLLVLDGCSEACALRRLREIGVEPDLQKEAWQSRSSTRSRGLRGPCSRPSGARGSESSLAGSPSG